MPMIFVESFEEFDARHGSNALRVNDDIIWPDGASCSYFNREIRSEPHEDHVTLLQVRRLYAKEKKARVEAAFQQCKTIALDNPSQEAIDELTRLKTMVSEARNELNNIENELRAIFDASPEGQRRKQRLAWEEEQRCRNAVFIEHIESIEI